MISLIPNGSYAFTQVWIFRLATALKWTKACFGTGGRFVPNWSVICSHKLTDILLWFSLDYSAPRLTVSGLGELFRREGGVAGPRLLQTDAAGVAWPARGLTRSTFKLSHDLCQTERSLLLIVHRTMKSGVTAVLTEVWAFVSPERLRGLSHPVDKRRRGLRGRHESKSSSKKHIIIDSSSDVSDSKHPPGGICVLFHSVQANFRRIYVHLIKAKYD